MEVLDQDKANTLLNLISQQPDIDLNNLHDKDPNEIKSQLSIKKNNKKVRVEHLNNSKAFIEHSNDIDDIYNNIEEYSPDKEHKTR